MTVIEKDWPETEIYSIDEAFLDLSTLPANQRETFCVNLQKTIFKHTGIPVSIGIGRTKTLAKVANHVAKKKLKIPVFNVTGQERHWLSQMNPRFIKDRFNVVLQRTVLELSGFPCLELDDIVPKKSIMSSCSFGGLQSDYRVVEEAISHHCATACAKMRRQGLIAQHLSVFIRSNPFRDDLTQYANSIGFRLVNPTDDVMTLTKMAKYCLRRIYRQGIGYHKSGVLMSELIHKQHRQMDLFNQPTDEKLPDSEKIMAAMEGINRKYGQRTIRLASEGLRKQWPMKRQLKSLTIQRAGLICPLLM